MGKTAYSDLEFTASNSDGRDGCKGKHSRKIVTIPAGINFSL